MMQVMDGNTTALSAGNNLKPGKRCRSVFFQEKVSCDAFYKKARREERDEKRKLEDIIGHAITRSQFEMLQSSSFVSIHTKDSVLPEDRETLRALLDKCTPTFTM